MAAPSSIDTETATARARVTDQAAWAATVSARRAVPAPRALRIPYSRSLARVAVNRVRPVTARAMTKPMTVTIVKGTTVGAADFSDFDDVSERYRVRGEEDFVPIPREQWVSRRVEDIVDAILLMGRERTTAPIAPDLCADPAYIKMRLDRIALIELPQGEADRVKRSCNVK